MQLLPTHRDEVHLQLAEEDSPSALFHFGDQDDVYADAGKQGGMFPESLVQRQRGGQGHIRFRL